MNRIVVSGASGDLGRRITDLLLQEISPEQLTLTTRSPQKLTERVQKGVAVFQANYRDRDALERAYRGGDVLMLISGLDVTHRVPEHRNAINAAKAAGIKHVVYTSVAGIHPRNPTLSASDHIITEADLRASGLDFTVLRNATYAEVLPEIVVGTAVRTGKWYQVQGAGRLAPVSKTDVARCASRILQDPGFHAGAVYEISGPELLTFRQIVAIASKSTGTPIEYIEVTPEQRFEIWDALGVPRKYSDTMAAHPDAHMWASEELVSAEVAFGQGFHGILTDHVSFITGRQPRPLAEVFDESWRSRGK